MDYMIDNQNLYTLETLLDGLKELQNEIPNIEKLYNGLYSEEKYELQTRLVDEQYGFLINKEYSENMKNFNEYKDFNNILKELDNVKEIYNVYNGALNSKELKQDIINELKVMMNDLDMENNISKKMLKNIENQFFKRFETIDQVSFVLKETIDTLVEEINLNKNNVDVDIDR